jgi:hypothetical protein
VSVFDHRVASVPLPIERDRLMLLMVAMNMGATGMDVFMAHSVGNVQSLFMFIPVVYTPLGVTTALLLAWKGCRQPLLFWLHMAAMALGFIVGVLGFAFHLRTVMLPGGEFVWGGVIFSAPVLATLAFSGIACLGVVAAMDEVKRGRHLLPGLGEIPLFFHKRQIYCILLGLGVAAAAMSAAIEHAQEGYINWTMWLPVLMGGLIAGSLIGHGARRKPPVGELIFILIVVGVAVILGMMGFAFHAAFDAGPSGRISIERMVHGAPLFAPTLFADLGLLALIAVGRKRRRTEYIIEPEPGAVET